LGKNVLASSTTLRISMKLPLKLATLLFCVASLITGAGLLAATVYNTPYTISTIAGVIAGKGSQDGTGINATFNRPGGVAMDGSGNTYVADSSNNAIRLIDSNGVTITIAGTAGKSGKTDGTNALFNGPWGITVDGNTNLFVTDSGNNTVRMIAPTMTYTIVPMETIYQSDIFLTTNTVTTTLYIDQTVTVSGSGNTTNTNSTFTNISPPVTIYRLIATNYSITNLVSVATNIWSVSTLAGSAQGSLDGTNANARFNNPKGIVVDGNDNLYVTDTGNSTIRKITPGFNSVILTNGTNITTNYYATWVVTTLAGKAGTNGSTNGTGTNALFDGPTGIALDNASNLYIADSGNSTIRLIDPNSNVTTFAGTPGVTGSANGTGTNALFNDPVGIAVSGGTNLYVTDSGNYLIRLITPGAVVTTFAGTGTNGKGNGTGTNASFGVLAGIAANTNGMLAVADNGNNMIRLLTTNAAVSSLAGDGFFQPFGVGVDAKTNIYVADTGNNIIRQIDTNGTITILAGTAGTNGSADGIGTNATFNQPLGLALDAKTNIYVTDSGNYTVRKISPVATNVPNGPTNIEQILTVRSNTTTISISVTNLTTTTINGSSTNVSTTINYVTNNPTYSNSSVTTTNWIASNMVTSNNWVVTTLAGQAGVAGGADGIGTNATFNLPDGIALDAGSNLYIADTANDTIRTVSPVVATNTNGLTTNWVVATPVGTAGMSGSADGTNSAARFNLPEGVVVLSGSTNLYVTDSGNNTIRQVVRNGTNWVVTTLAGTAGVAGSSDGTGTNASFSTPFGINVDGKGTLYISDRNNQTLRKISVNGVVSTLAGSPGVIGSANGTGPNASFYQPAGVAVGTNTNTLFVADVNNNAIRYGISATTPTKTQTIRFSAIPRQTYGKTNAVILSATASSALPVTLTSADPTVATVSGTNLTVTGAGYVLITASQEGNGTYKPAPNINQLLTVFKGSQTITMGLIGVTNLVYGETVPLVATNSSVVPIIFTTSNTNVVISSSNAVTTLLTNGGSITSNSAIINFSGTGTATITASARGANYNTTSISQLLGLTNVAAASQTITFSLPTNGTSVTFTNGGTISLTATASSGLPVTFISGNTNVLTISGTSGVYVGAGTTTITATQAGNTNFSAATPVTNLVVVAPATQTLTFSSPANNASIAYTNGGTFPLIATTSSVLPVTFVSGNTNVLTISNATATMVGIGTTTISVTQNGNNNYYAATPVTNAVFVANAQTITFSSPTTNSGLSYTNGGTFPLVATSSSGLPVTFTSGNTNILTISNTTATYVGVGTTTITATQPGDGTNYIAATPVTNKVIVAKGAQVVTFSSPTNGTSVTFTNGETIPLIASSSSGLGVTFTSGNTNVLTISNATATVIGTGTSTITALQAGNNLYAAAPITNNSVIVAPATQTVSFTSPTNGTSLTFTNGGTIPLVATASSGLPVVFASANTNILTISGTNSAIMKGTGTTTITATQAGSPPYYSPASATNTVILH